MKHVERTKSGSWEYRRRVSKGISAGIIKREFKQKLGDSEREALKAWPQYHDEVEREIANAPRRLALQTAARKPGATDREAYVEALRRRADLIASGADEKKLELAADTLAESYH